MLKNLEVLVLRADKPRIGFTWELRQYGKGTPIIAGIDLFPSQADARRSGVAALAKFTADGLPDPQARGPETGAI